MSRTESDCHDRCLRSGCGMTREEHGPDGQCALVYGFFMEREPVGGQGEPRMKESAVKALRAVQSEAKRLHAENERLRGAVEPLTEAYDHLIHGRRKCALVCVEHALVALGVDSATAGVAGEEGS